MIFGYVSGKMLVITAATSYTELRNWADPLVDEDVISITDEFTNKMTSEWKKYKHPVYFKTFDSNDDLGNFKEQHNIEISGPNRAYDNYLDMHGISEAESIYGLKFNSVDERSIGEIMKEDMGITETNDPFDNRTPEQIKQALSQKSAIEKEKAGMTGDSFSSKTAIQGDNMTIGGIKASDDGTIKVDAHKRAIAVGNNSIFDGLIGSNNVPVNIEQDLTKPNAWVFSVNQQLSTEEKAVLISVTPAQTWYENGELATGQEALLLKMLDDSKWSLEKDNVLKYTGIPHMSLSQRAAQAALDLIDFGLIEDEEIVTSFILVDKEKFNAFVMQVKQVLAKADDIPDEDFDYIYDIDVDRLTAKEAANIFKETEKKFRSYSPMPEPADYYFMMNEKLTKSKSMEGKDTPVFEFKVNKAGPSEGKFNLDDIMTLLQGQDGFHFISKGFWSFNKSGVDKIELQKISVKLLTDAGFINAPNIVADRSEFKKKVKDKLEQDGQLQRNLTPEEFQHGFSRDTTTTMAGTGSHGRHHISGKLGKGDYALGLKGQEPAISIIDSNTRVLSILELPKEARNLYSGKIDDEGILFIEYNGIKVSKDLYAIPVSTDIKLDTNLCYNVRKTAHISLFGASVTTFTIFNEYNDAYVAGEFNGKPFILRLHRAKAED